MAVASLSPRIPATANVRAGLPRSAAGIGRSLTCRAKIAAAGSLCAMSRIHSTDGPPWAPGVTGTCVTWNRPANLTFRRSASPTLRTPIQHQGLQATSRRPGVAAISAIRASSASIAASAVEALRYLNGANQGRARQVVQATSAALGSSSDFVLAPPPQVARRLRPAN